MTTAPLMQKSKGFTLLEVMLVLLLMGLAVGYVVFNAFGTTPAETLKKEAQRFQVVMDMAADYAVMNQVQLGVYLDKEKHTYEFMRLNDEQQWQRIDDDKLFTAYELPEEFELTLELDDLPWEQEESLFDDEIFDEELSIRDEGVDIGNEEDKAPPPPQILLFSSGEITPFVVTFAYEPDFANNDPVYYLVKGKDVPPLEREGPLNTI